MDLQFRHVDVFTTKPLTGNGLVVFVGDRFPSKDLMLALTQEMRQFEAIFLVLRGQGAAEARIFTTQEELEFAGHPLLGAATVLHDLQRPEKTRFDVQLKVGKRLVDVANEVAPYGFTAEMNQGTAIFGSAPGDIHAIVAGLGLTEADLHPELAPAVVSTGLPYLIVPVGSTEALARARIRIGDLESRLARVGAKFVYVFDPEALEGRTWENDGSLEDVATGSAAGPVAAYLVRAGRIAVESTIQLTQGRFVGRPSELRVRVDGRGRVHVGGGVVPISAGQIAAQTMVGAALTRTSS